MKKLITLICAGLLVASSCMLASCTSKQTLHVGDALAFGNYEGIELQWDVLEATDGKALIVAADEIYCGAFSEQNNTSWAQSDARARLNGEVFETAFSADEQKRIIDTATSVDGVETTDKLFLLSAERVETDPYFNNNKARADIGNNWWFTLTPASSEHCMIGVGGNGRMKGLEFEASAQGGIRPAMWIAAS